MLCTGHSRRRNLSFIAISLAWRRAAPALHGATLITLSADGSSDYRRQGSGRRRYRLRRTHVVGASGKLIMAPIVARSVLPSASILRVASSTYGVPRWSSPSREYGSTGSCGIADSSSRPGPGDYCYACCYATLTGALQLQVWCGPACKERCRNRRSLGRDFRINHRFSL